jgi:glyceraldehyde-3-phosphate dehydrogenase (NAD(P))
MLRRGFMSGSARVRVAVNGYGVIGKRVADAVALQDDMVLAGVSDVVPDYRVRVTVERGYAVYAPTSGALDAMQASGVSVAGTLGDLLQEVDVVVDCAAKTGAR